MFRTVVNVGQHTTKELYTYTVNFVIKTGINKQNDHSTIGKTVTDETICPLHF